MAGEKQQHRIHDFDDNKSDDRHDRHNAMQSTFFNRHMEKPLCFNDTFWSIFLKNRN